MTKKKTAKKKAAKKPSPKKKATKKVPAKKKAAPKKAVAPPLEADLHEPLTPRILTPEELPIPEGQAGSRPVTSGSVTGEGEPQILDSLGPAGGRPDPYAPPPTTLVGKAAGEAVDLTGKDPGEEEE